MPLYYQKFLYTHSMESGKLDTIKLNYVYVINKYTNISQEGNALN